MHVGNKEHGGFVSSKSSQGPTDCASTERFLLFTGAVADIDTWCPFLHSLSSMPFEFRSQRAEVVHKQHCTIPSSAILYMVSLQQCK